MNEKEIKDAIKQRIVDKVKSACEGEAIADAIMGTEQNQDFIDTKEQDKVQDVQIEMQNDKDVTDVKEDKESDKTNREIGKFKNPEELLRAYGMLEKEFTKKSQKLSKLEALADGESQGFDDESFKVAADKFFENTPSAKPFAKDIALKIIEKPELKKDKNCLSVALVQVLIDKFRTPEQLMQDGQFLNDYVLSSSKVKDAIIGAYLKDIRDGQPPATLSGDGLQCVAPSKKIRSIEEAGRMFLKNNE